LLIVFAAVYSPFIQCDNAVEMANKRCPTEYFLHVVVSYLHGIPCYRTHALRKKHLIRTKYKHERSTDPLIFSAILILSLANIVAFIYP